MKYTPVLIFSALAAFGSALPAATTAPMGGMLINCKANSDTAVGLTFTRPVEFQGRVDSVNGNEVTLAGTPGWTADQFVYDDGTQDNHYYVLFASGSKEGAFYTITANTSNTLTLDLNPYALASPDDLTDVATGGASTGDIVRIIPYWTPGSLIGSDAPDDLYILIYDTVIGGINLSSTATYRHFNGFGWYVGANDVSDNIIYPGEAFIIRNQNNAGYDLVVAGAVPMAQHRTIIRTVENGVKQDNRIVFISPIPEMIGNLNLGSLDPETPGEQLQLLVFDNDATSGQNKSAIKTLNYFEGFGWYDGPTRVDDPNDEPNQFFLEPGQAYILRRPATNSEDVVWTALPSYLE